MMVEEEENPRSVNFQISNYLYIITLAEQFYRHLEFRFFLLLGTVVAWLQIYTPHSWTTDFPLHIICNENFRGCTEESHDCLFPYCQTLSKGYQQSACFEGQNRSCPCLSHATRKWSSRHSWQTFFKLFRSAMQAQIFLNYFLPRNQTNPRD